MIRVQISLWSLGVSIEADPQYPDQVNDLVNRASQLFITGLAAAKNQGLDLTQINPLEIENDEDEG